MKSDRPDQCRTLRNPIGISHIGVWNETHFIKLARCLCVLACIFAGAHVPAQESVREDIPSPDGKFVFKFDKADPEVPFGIFAKETGAILVKAPEEANNAFVDSVKCIWSPDSKQFALNYRAGARYETAQVYRWNGKAFVELPSFEEMLADKLEAEKEKKYKAAGIKKDVYKRRIWDCYRVRRWIDAATVEVDAYSIRAVVVDGEESADFDGTLRFRLQRNKKGAWVIVKQENITPEDLEKAEP